MVAWSWKVNCHADSTLDVVKKECETLSECELHANNAEFGDPCFLTKKYLTVKRRLFLRIYFVQYPVIFIIIYFVLHKK